MEITRFIYQDNPNYEVEFEPTGSDNVMVNATMMAAIFGKKVHEFMSNESTKSFIEVCLRNGNSRFLNIKKRSELVSSDQRNGTWMHRILALKFAAWLDPEFELWVYSTIDQILNHFYKEQRDTRLEKLYAKERKAALRIELIEKHPDVAEYFKLEDREREASNKLIKLIKEQEDQLRFEFKDFTTPSQS